ncbi:MAG: phosphate ABC transporter permease PstA [Candidatus Altiarchaeota archaeon]
MDARRLEEAAFKALGLASILIIISCLLLMILTILIKGLPGLSWAMVSQEPQSGFYLGGGGGILNAIIGSIYLAAGGTALAFAVSLPTAIFLQREYSDGSGLAEAIRSCLDILWGIPSIIYGAFGFIIMLYLGMRASLLAGILSLAFVVFPIMTRSFDEILRTIPPELKEVSYAVGATRLETMLSVTLRQAAPGILTGIILSFGRAIGDAASILFTAGYSDQVPRSLMDPVASLPLAIFFQFGTPYQAVQARAYTSAVILLLIVLLLTSMTRIMSSISRRYLIR